MTTATQTESADRPTPLREGGVAGSPDGRNCVRSSLGTRHSSLLRALHAEWRKLRPNLTIEPLDGETPAQAERRVRLAWTNEQLKSRNLPAQAGLKVESWNDLKPNEGRFLLKKMKEESGSNAAWRAMKLAQIAAELFGSDWNGLLRERLIQRFRVAIPESLVAREFWSEAEELLSRIARRDGVEIEVVRQRFFGKKAEG